MGETKLLEEFAGKAECPVRDFPAYLEYTAENASGEEVKRGCSLIQLSLSGWSNTSIAQGYDLRVNEIARLTQLALGEVHENYEKRVLRPGLRQFRDARYVRYFRILVKLCEFKEPALV